MTSGVGVTSDTATASLLTSSRSWMSAIWVIGTVLRS